MIVTRCEDCHAHIVWAVMPFDSLIMMDPLPSHRGNIRLEAAADGGLLATVALDRPPDVPLYSCHYATCPKYGEDRGNRKPRKQKP